MGRTAGRLADWTWLGSTLVALVELSMKRAIVRSSMHQRKHTFSDEGRLLETVVVVENKLYKESMQSAGQIPDEPERETEERNLKQLKQQLYWIRVTRAKLLMDLIFVSECL